MSETTSRETIRTHMEEAERHGDELVAAGDIGAAVNEYIRGSHLLGKWLSDTFEQDNDFDIDFFNSAHPTVKRLRAKAKKLSPSRFGIYAEEEKETRRADQFSRARDDGNLPLLLHLYDEYAHELLVVGKFDEAQPVLRQGVAILREHGTRSTDYGAQSFGSVEATALRLLAELARLVVPSPEAVALADELLFATTGPRSHPMYSADAHAVCAEIAVKLATIDDAVTAVHRAVKSAASCCFHQYQALAQADLAERLKDGNKHDEAESYAAAAVQSIADRIPGHTHMWEMTISGPIPDNDPRRNPWLDYSEFPLTQPFGALSMPWWPYRGWKTGLPRPLPKPAEDDS